MTVVPLTQASSRLGVDVKTLRRWLVQAQLPLQADPQDARTKGVRLEHLHLLAHQHQRSLASRLSDPPVPQAAAPTPLPAAFLAIPELLNDLHAQITTLQHQVATLTHLLQQTPVPPVVPPAPAEKTRASSPRATRATPPPAVKVPSKPVHVIPRVEYREDGRYVVICPKKGLLLFEPESEAWFAWVAEQDAFRFVGKEGHFTAHHEWRVPKGAWRAHRHIRNRVHTRRLAPNHELTIAILEQAAQALQALLS